MRRMAVIGAGVALAAGALYVAGVAAAVTLWASLWTMKGLWWSRWS